MRRLLVLAGLVGVAALAQPALAQAASGWCGTDQLSTDRPDTVGGRKVHVIYAIPADGADRFRDTAPLVVADLAAITDWWRREDPTRVPRWDLFPFPGCDGGPSALDLSFVRLPRPGDAYFRVATRLSALVTDLQDAFRDPAKKYLVYYDGAVAQEGVCGAAFGREAPTLGGAFATGSVFLQAHPGATGCGTLGVGGYRAMTAAHEFLHTIGAVPSGASHSCNGDLAHICDDGNDVMAPAGRSSSLADYKLDAGRDDYYGHSGSWWDVQDSLWLATNAPDRRLSVEVAGGGSGAAVTSDLTGIACPGLCSVPWADSDVVSLLPSPGPGERFLRWEGSCSGVAACRLVMDGDKSVRAVFGPAFVRLTARVRGRGLVASTVVPLCRSTCGARIEAGRTVALRAVADPGWRFVRWRGCTSVTRAVCRVKPTANRVVTATFRRR